MLDIHSHILPGVDDGAKDIESALKILNIMKSQGVTDVIATPHFYPNYDNLEDFTLRTREAYDLLRKEAAGKGLPEIFLGSEVLYFKGIGSSSSLDELCLGNTNYLLVELDWNDISPELFNDIIDLRDELGIIPIIAHIERYAKMPGFKHFLAFVQDEAILTQINSSSLVEKFFKRSAVKLLKNSCVTFIGSDSHSPDSRPPMFDKCFEAITAQFGAEYSERLINNSEFLLEKLKNTQNGDNI